MYSKRELRRVVGNLPYIDEARSKNFARPLDSRLLILLVTVVWIGFTFFVATMPRMPQPPGISARLISPLGHLGTHFVLTFLVYLLIASPRPQKLGKRLVALVVAIGFSSSFGLLIEGVQHVTPDRAAEISDVVTNLIGVTAAASLILVFDQVGLNRKLLPSAVISLVLSVIALTTVSALIWDPSLPRVGDHWHARYSISICGEEIPPLPGTHGGIHTHGQGFIHIHPLDESQAGKSATLALFMHTSGGALTNRSLTLPSGQTFRNGQFCPDGRPGNLKTYVNGNLLEKPSNYILKNLDRVSIIFDSTDGNR